MKRVTLKANRDEINVGTFRFSVGLNSWLGAIQEIKRASGCKLIQSVHFSDSNVRV